MEGAGGALEPGEAEDGPGSLVTKFLTLENDMATKLSAIQYDERVRVVYNPLEYARQTHEFFVRAALSSGRPKVIFLGMNPGPHGMSQNGVPFGDTVPIRDWLCIRGEVHKPYPEHPKRPVDGLQCSKTEVSGKRFWGLMKELCGGDASRFLQSCFVHNFCPLSFMMDNGRNITPDQLRGEGKKKLHEVCDEALRDVLALLRPELVVGIGKYATERAQTAVSRLESAGGMRVEGIAHPSPASPEANQGWHKLAMHQLNGAGLLQLVGWSVSEELLREAAEEAQRITAAKITRSAKISRSPTKRRSTDTPSGVGGTNQVGGGNAPSPAATAPASKPTRKKRATKNADNLANTTASTNTTAPAPAPPGASASPANGAAWTPSPQTTTSSVTTGVTATPEAKPPTYDNFNSGFAAAGLAPQLGHALWAQPQWGAAPAAPLWGAAPLPYYNGYTAYSPYDPSKHWPANPNPAAQFRSPADNTASSWNWNPLAFPPGASTAPTPHKDSLTVAGAPGSAPTPYNVGQPAGQPGGNGNGGGPAAAPVNNAYGGIQQHGGPPHAVQPQQQQQAQQQQQQQQQLAQQLQAGQLAPQPNPAHMAHLQLPAQAFPPNAVSSAGAVHPTQTSVAGGGVSMFSSPMDLASSANSLASMQAVQAVQAAGGGGGPYDANVRSLVNTHLYSLQES